MFPYTPLPGDDELTTLRNRLDALDAIVAELQRGSLQVGVLDDIHDTANAYKVQLVKQDELQGFMFVSSDGVTPVGYLSAIEYFGPPGPSYDRVTLHGTLQLYIQAQGIWITDDVGAAIANLTTSVATITPVIGATAGIKVPNTVTPLFTVGADGNITKINGVTTSWPGSQGAANTTLHNDGAGAFTWTKIVLTTDVTGTLPVANGGSGVTSLSDILGTSNQVTVSGGGSRVIGGNVTLSLPQNIHTAATPTFQSLTLSHTAPSLAWTDTTASAKSLTVVVDANIANIRESAGGSGSLMALDLANNRVGIGTATPTSPAHVAQARAADLTLLALEVLTDITDGDIQRIAFQSETSLDNAVRTHASLNAISSTLGGASAYGLLTFSTMNSTTLAERMRIDNYGNVGIGATAFGAASTNSRNLGIASGVAASSSPADYAAIWVADANGTAGKAWPHFRPEDGTNRVMVGVSGTTAVSTGTGTVKMGGATNRNSVGWLTLHDHAGTTVYVPYWTTITG